MVTDSDDDEAADRLVPPTAERVARRTLVLLGLALTAECALEHACDQAFADAVHEQLTDWSVTEELEPYESALRTTPVSQWERQDAVNALWRYEGLGVLVWAHGLVELPPDVPFEAPTVTAALLPARDLGLAHLLERPLRPSTDVDTLADAYFTAHWRLREFGRVPAALDLRSFATTAWFGPLSLTGLPLADDDLAVGGAPLAQADGMLVRRATSVVVERRTAVGWLRGEDPVYSQVRLDT